MFNQLTHWKINAVWCQAITECHDPSGHTYTPTLKKPMCLHFLWDSDTVSIPHTEYNSNATWEDNSYIWYNGHSSLGQSNNSDELTLLFSLWLDYCFQMQFNSILMCVCIWRGTFCPAMHNLTEMCVAILRECGQSVWGCSGLASPKGHNRCDMHEWYTWARILVKNLSPQDTGSHVVSSCHLFHWQYCTSNTQIHLEIVSLPTNTFSSNVNQYKRRNNEWRGMEGS